MVPTTDDRMSTIYARGLVALQARMTRWAALLGMEVEQRLESRGGRRARWARPRGGGAHAPATHRSGTAVPLLCTALVVRAGLYGPAWVHMPAVTAFFLSHLTWPSKNT